MNEKYRVWGILVTVIFVILAIPLVLSNAFGIMFSYMGSDSPWGSYLGLGPSIILAVLTVIMSIHSMRFADIHSFSKMETILILMLGSLIMLFGLGYAYFFYALLYSLTGILQIRKFWRFAAPEVPGKHLKRAMAVMVIALSISCASLAFGLIKSMPKMSADKKGIKFVSGSLHFYDDWGKRPSLGQLAQEQEVQGILLPKYTFVFFYDSGELSMVQLRERDMCVRIQGINCAGSGNIYFHKSGKLSSAVLAESQFINGKLYQKGDSLGFNEDGSIKVLTNTQDDD